VSYWVRCRPWRSTAPSSGCFHLGPVPRRSAPSLFGAEGQAGPTRLRYGGRDPWLAADRRWRARVVPMSVMAACTMAGGHQTSRPGRRATGRPSVPARRSPWLSPLRSTPRGSWPKLEPCARSRPSPTLPCTCRPHPAISTKLIWSSETSAPPSPRTSTYLSIRPQNGLASAVALGTVVATRRHPRSRTEPGVANLVGRRADPVRGGAAGAARGHGDVH
jgi:hypothetical protein